MKRVFSNPALVAPLTFWGMVLTAPVLIAAKPEAPATAGSAEKAPQTPSAPGKAGESAPWRVADATLRFEVLAKDAPKSPEAGWAVVVPELGHTTPKASDLVLMDSTGRSLPIAVLHRSEGGSVVLVADGMVSGQKYHLYCGGGRTRPSPTWNPRHGLFMEVRRLPADASLDSAAALRAAWDAAQVEGGQFVSTLSQSDNPFGETTNFMSRFVGVLRPGAKTLSVYTGSMDASFVWFNQKLLLEYPGLHTQFVNAKTAVRRPVDFPPQGLAVEYLHAKKGGGNSAAALGYLTGPEQAKLFEKGDWNASGGTELVRMENPKFGVLPPCRFKHRDYIGWDGLWFFDSEIAMDGALSPQTQVSWVFSNGSKASGSRVNRLVSGLSPLMAMATLSNGSDTLRLALRIHSGGAVPQAGVNSEPDRARYFSRIEGMDLENLGSDELRGFFKFAKEFGTDQQIAKIAAAWMVKNPNPEDPLWISGALSRLRGLSQTDPKGALAELGRYDPSVVKRYLREFALFELETRVFLLKDNEAVKVVDRVGPMFAQDLQTQQLMRIRVGDLYRVQGRVREAADIYRTIQKAAVDDTEGRKFAAQDRAFSVEVENLIEGGNRFEAEARMLRWEAEHPAAKLESDFLLLNGRLLMLFGRYAQALQEIDSFKALNPDSPYQIHADFHRARALFELGRKQEARKIWSGIATQYPRHRLASEAASLSTQP